MPPFARILDRSRSKNPIASSLRQSRPPSWQVRAREHPELRGFPVDLLRSAGVTHVLLSRAGYEYVTLAGFDPITPEDHETLQELIEGQLDLVEDLGGAYVLYRLR